MNSAFKLISASCLRLNSNSRTALEFKTPPQFKWEWLATLLLSTACDISIQLPITHCKVGPNRSHTNSLCQVHSWHSVNRACARFCTECEKERKIVHRVGEMWAAVMFLFFPLPFCLLAVLSVLATAHYDHLISWDWSARCYTSLKCIIEPLQCDSQQRRPEEHQWRHMLQTG